jgi:peptidoglycan/LPS O-acetylase OafA/YrhL
MIPFKFRSKAPATDDLLTYEVFREVRYFPVLDGVRAVSVLLVILSHPGAQQFWDWLHGANGVTIFFVLSGFLITTLALREESRRGALDVKSFYIRRFFRIYPVYTVVLALYCLLVLGLGFESGRRDLFVHQLPYYLLGFPEHGFFFNNQGAPPFSGAWSLGIEEKFYLIWPMLAFFFLRGRFRVRLGICAVAGALFTTAPFVWGVGLYLSPYAQITIGCAIGLLLHERAYFDRLRVLGRPEALLVVFVCLAALQLTELSRITHSLYVLYGAVAGVALVAVVMSRSRWTSWLEHRWMVFLGRISYALYLTHNFGLNAMEKVVPEGWGLFGSLLTTATGLVIAVAISYALHVTVERPLIALGRRLAHRATPFPAV